eukprot:2318918-Rhodomonas_salina.3
MTNGNERALGLQRWPAIGSDWIRTEDGSSLMGSRLRMDGDWDTSGPGAAMGQRQDSGGIVSDSRINAEMRWGPRSDR